MKIFSAPQIKAWDACTIQQEEIHSIDLMERAAITCFNWITQHFELDSSFIIFCGRGNNGGDGIAIARLLHEHNYKVEVFVAGLSRGSNDFEKNLCRFREISNNIVFLNKEEAFPPLKNEIVIDALFGTGLNKRPAGIYPFLIDYINEKAKTIISIDVPSGMYIDNTSLGNKIIKSNFTLTFQNEKLAFLMPENAGYNEYIKMLDIKLSAEYEENEKSLYELVDGPFVKKIYKSRKAFTHKGNYGHACLIAGSYGMMGAAVLGATACIRSGVGKMTCFIPKTGYDILQVSIPEAMCKTFGKKHLKKIKDDFNFDVLAIGPGIGMASSLKELLKSIFKKFKKPMVIDADALNVLSQNPSLYKKIPEGSILTPHPKEFERLFGKTPSDFHTIELALKKAAEFRIYIVLKGHHTFIATPSGKGYFNSTGNAGMASGGSGDVLTGIIAGLLAQKYHSLQACLLGVYLHGLAGDLASRSLTQEAMKAGDIIDYLPEAYKEIMKK
ncbi:MAG: NAD(P)H-hydrate dehydratase [Ginsengibacter sp.]